VVRDTGTVLTGQGYWDCTDWSGILGVY
jgi:hypothetical protein